jgi:hypothetical protein
MEIRPIVRPRRTLASEFATSAFISDPITLFSITLFGGPSFTPPSADPTAPNGYVTGVSGWLSPESLREVGLSFDVKF